MNDPMGFDSPEPSTPQPGYRPAAQRPAGSPLPVGGGARTPQPALDERPQSSAPPAQAFNVDGVLNLIKTVLPFAQKLLPLLDGMGGGASEAPPPPAAAIARPAPAPQQQAPEPNPAPTPIVYEPQPPLLDLEPLENGLSELRGQQRELRGQLSEQNLSLKRVEDHLEMVREATDRNTLEQQELLEDLKVVGTKINLFVTVALVLLAASIGLNIYLIVHIRHVLP